MLTADQGAFLSPNSGSVGQDAARNRTKQRLRPRWPWASRGRVEGNMSADARKKWVRPAGYVRKPAKPCEFCGRLIRWRKDRIGWIAVDLSGGDHARYCEPQRWDPLGKPKNWQTPESWEARAERITLERWDALQEWLKSEPAG